MGREDYYKRFPNPAKEQTDFIEEFYSKGVRDDELIEAYSKKYIDNNEAIQFLLEESLYYEKEFDFGRAIYALEQILEILPADESSSKLNAEIIKHIVKLERLLKHVLRCADPEGSSEDNKPAIKKEVTKESEKFYKKYIATKEYNLILNSNNELK